ncbi:RING/U-box superfamily protein [Perilla frutescens var. hirtella]|nr:RING/U-box superfamily protein [Perilla frutescens var. frutescens]KAH6794444.1 RING/U-box superfamily protein [Perilla frutescens var. hirtella]
MSNTFSRRCARLFNPVNADSAAAAEPEREPEKLYIEALLPGVTYSAANFPEKSDCAICLDSFREGDSCRKIPVCKHLFHSECVDRWIGRKPTCPVCRTRVDLDPLGSPGISGGDDRWKRLWTVHFEEGTSY